MSCRGWKFECFDFVTSRQSCASFFRTKWKAMEIIRMSSSGFHSIWRSIKLLRRAWKLLFECISVFNNLHTTKRLVIVDKVQIFAKIYASSWVSHCIANRLKHQLFRSLFRFNCKAHWLWTFTRYVNVTAINVSKFSTMKVMLSNVFIHFMKLGKSSETTHHTRYTAQTLISNKVNLYLQNTGLNHLP